MTTNYRYLMIAGLLCSTAFAGTGIAQEQETADSGGLTDIIVTAEKRDTNLQKTPIAISVYSAENIEKQRLVDIRDIGLRTPGFSFSQPIKTQTTLAMRGAASLEDSPGADQGVAIFVDEIYIGQPSAFDFDLYDLERIEVLRGPQGTIFGKNVVGGALNIITRNPTFEPAVKAEATLGRFGRFDAKASFSGPLSEQLAALVSFSSRSSDGYIRNLTTGNMLEQDDQRGVRAKLLWKPSDTFEALLAADYSRDKSYGIAEHYFGPTPLANGPVTSNPRQSEQDKDGFYNRKLFGGSLKMTYSLNDTTDIVSVTGYRESHHHTQIDADATPARLLEFTDNDADIRQFSQELRITGEAGNLNYIAGLYYLNVKYGKIETLYEAGAPTSLAELATGGIPETEVLGQTITTRSYAGYAQGTYRFTDALRLTAGVRYTWEKKSGNTVCIDPALQCGSAGPYNQPVSESWGALTPKATLDVDLAPNMLAYATISRGFKSGGFASGFDLPASAEVPFDPEFAWNYEIGFKSRFLNNRLQLNVALFKVDYSDLQVRQFDAVGRTIVGNAGSARVHGVEAELLTRPVSGLELFANYSYQDSKYKSLVLEGDDFTGNQLIFTPKHSLTTGFSYTAAIGSGSLTFDGDVMFRSRTFYTVDNDPEQSSKYKGLINGSVTYNFPGDQWSLQLWGKNLSNERVRGNVGTFDALFAIPAADFFAGNAAYTGRYIEPRTWGATLRFNM